MEIGITLCSEFVSIAHEPSHGKTEDLRSTKELCTFVFIVVSSPQPYYGINRQSEANSNTMYNSLPSSCLSLLDFHGGFAPHTYICILQKSPAIDSRQVLILRLQTGALPRGSAAMCSRRILLGRWWVKPKIPFQTTERAAVAHSCSIFYPLYGLLVI